MVILMLGAQGTGKGTVAGILSENLGWPQISTGDIFRKNIKEKTELGTKANEYMAKGELVPDEITVPMVVDRLNEKDAQEGAILDGFPRNIAQAEKLEEILKEKGKKVDLVINLTSPKDEIITRILNRRVCSNQACKTTYNTTMHPPKTPGICDKCGAELVQREDDADKAAIQKRLELYDEKTLPLVEFYEEKGVLCTEEISEKTGRLGKDVAEDILKEIK